jgi:hypothetical protein
MTIHESEAMENMKSEISGDADAQTPSASAPTSKLAAQKVNPPSPSPPGLSTAHTISPHLQLRERLASAREERAIAASTTSWQPINWLAGVVGSEINYGCSCNLSCLRPKVEQGDASSLIVLVGNSDPSHPEQTIQAGWTRIPSAKLTPNVQDEDQCQLFVFFNTVGGATLPPRQDFISGYNDEVRGWEGIPGAFRLGLDVLPACHIEGPQSSVELKFQLQGDRWNLRLNGTVIGYYPTSLFTVDRTDPGNPRDLDASKTLADHATSVGFIGFVNDSHSGGLTSTAMGSGKWPEEAYGKSAFISNMQYQPAPTNVNPAMADAHDGWQKLVSDPMRYDCLIAWESSSQWQSYVYIGGPGCEAGGWSSWNGIGGVFTQDSNDPTVVFDEFALGCQITAISRKSAVVDLFVIGQNGKVYNSYWYSDDWSGFNNDWRLLDWGQGVTFSAQTKIVAVAKTPDNLDIFAMGKDNKIYTAWWSDGHDWSGWRKLGDQVFPPNITPPLLAAISRTEDQIDVFVENGGVVYRSWWIDSVTDWITLSKDWEIIDGNGLIPGQLSLVVFSRTPGTMDVITSALDTLDGIVSVTINTWTDGRWDGTTFTEGSWTRFVTVRSPSIKFPPVTLSIIRLSGVSRTANSIELFAISTDFAVYTTRCPFPSDDTDPSDNWKMVGDRPTAFSLASDIIAVSRRPSSVDVFVSGSDGQIYTASRDDLLSGDEEWTNWTSLGGKEFPLTVNYGFGVSTRNDQTMAVVGCGTGSKVWATEWVDPACGPRPFYCMSHNPNNMVPKDEPLISLQTGANSLAPDVNRSSDPGNKLVVSHRGLIGNAWGDDSDTDFIQYLQHVHALAIQFPQLSLIAFDCKPSTHDPDVGLVILTAIRQHLTLDLPLDIVLSVSSQDATSVSMFDKIKTMLGPRESIAIDEENTPVNVAAYFQSIHATRKAGYGNGHTIQVPVLVPNLRFSIEQGVAVRTGYAELQYVYEWTTDDVDRMRKFIRIGVDGVMSNFEDSNPLGLQQLVDLVNSDLEMRRLVRMATPRDRLLQTVSAGYVLIVRTSSQGAAGTDADITFAVRGELGIVKKRVNTSLQGRMENDGTDFVTIQARDVGSLIDITIRNDMANSVLGNSRWRCESIKVVSARYGVKKAATFGVDIGAFPVTRAFL